VRRWRGRSVALLAAAAVLLPSCGLYRPGCPAGMEVLADRLTNPRGITRGPDGALYLAEAGDDATGGRITRVGPDGAHAVLVAGLPHSVNAGVEDVGTADVAFRHGGLYAIEAEAEGELASSLFRLDAGGPAKVADLLAFEGRANPDGAGVESNPFALRYSLDEDRFYATDGAGNDLLRIAPDGAVEVVAAWHDDPVPTGFTRGPDGALYVALFGKFPHEPGGGRVDRIGTDGAVTTVVDHLTMPIGVAFGGDGLYVLEFAAGLDLQPRLRFRPDSGRLLRIVGGRREVVVDRLRYPTALVPDPNGGFLVADGGAMVGAGRGRVMHVSACDVPIGGEK
jgi:hypothetical protein